MCYTGIPTIGTHLLKFLFYLLLRPIISNIILISTKHN